MNLSTNLYILGLESEDYVQLSDSDQFALEMQLGDENFRIPLRQVERVEPIEECTGIPAFRLFPIDEKNYIHVDPREMGGKGFHLVNGNKLKVEILDSLEGKVESKYFMAIIKPQRVVLFAKSLMEPESLCSSIPKAPIN